MKDTVQSRYALRNDASKTFELQARAVTPSARDLPGCSVEIDITSSSGDSFRYRVEFSGDFVATKSDFTESMFLGTAVSVATAQLESLRHRSTRLLVHRASGLIDTEPLTS